MLFLFVFAYSFILSPKLSCENFKRFNYLSKFVDQLFNSSKFSKYSPRNAPHQKQLMFLTLHTNLVYAKKNISRMGGHPKPTKKSKQRT